MSNSQSAEVKFSFFAVNYGNGLKRPLAEMLLSVRERAYPDRVATVHKIPRFISDEMHTDRLRGSMAFLFTSKRSKAIPMKLTAEFTKESLGFVEGEGLAEDMVVACSSDGSIIALQNNRYALTDGSLEQYIKKMVPDSDISLDPILTKDSIDRFFGAGEIRKVSVRIAGGVLQTPQPDSNTSLTELVATENVMMDAPHLELTWSAGRSGDGLGGRLRNFVKGLADLCRGGDNRSVTKIEATVRDDDGKQVIDLLADRLICKKTIPMNIHGEIDRQSLLEAACAVLVDMYDELQSYAGREQ